ncbi:MAG TPA: LLM class flavin-dependent oxidoreductase, partial [Methanoculleus sp.]|nr:LLM class flavin-dependent oxidoreductase [Methanoculleus sp.]
VSIIRMLWKGGVQDYCGAYYTLDNAQIYELPRDLPPIRISAQGPMAAEVAGDIGDALIHFEQKPEEVIEAFRASGGEGKSCMIETAACYAGSEEEAKRTAYEWFPMEELRTAPVRSEKRWIGVPALRRRSLRTPAECPPPRCHTGRPAPTGIRRRRP